MGCPLIVPVEAESHSPIAIRYLGETLNPRPPPPSPSRMRNRPDRVHRHLPTSAHRDSIALGATLYAENCAICHADPVTGGERQFDAPRNDANGHTWHHPDRLLVKWVLESPPGGSTMPPFVDTLSEEEAAAIIGYIRSTWPADLQANHVELSQRWEEQVGAQ